MREEDVPGAHELAVAAFADLERRLHEPPRRRAIPAGAYVRLRRILATDPGGCWVAEDAGGAGGRRARPAARRALGPVAARRAARPAVHGHRQRAAGPDARVRRGRARRDHPRSPDSRALRAYARAGFALHPIVSALGQPAERDRLRRRPPLHAADHELAAAVDRAVRGAPHGADLDALAAGGCELLTLPGRGYAVHRAGSVKTIAAFDDEAAAALLRTVLARMPEGGSAEVDWITGSQQWAIDVAVAARLELRPGGAVCLRGEVGAFRPYLPGGAYL